MKAPPASEKPDPKKEIIKMEGMYHFLFFDGLVKRDETIAIRRIKKISGKVYGKIAERQ